MRCEITCWSKSVVIINVILIDVPEVGKYVTQLEEVEPQLSFHQIGLVYTAVHLIFLIRQIFFHLQA